jgi:hypothetical protein
VTNKLKVRMKEGIFALACMTPMTNPVTTPKSKMVKMENSPSTGMQSHTRTPPSIQIPTYDKSSEPITTTMEGPSPNSMSVTNCLRIVLRFKGLRNLPGYRAEKITMRAIKTIITG